MTSALLDANDNSARLDNKAILDSFVCALSYAASRGVTHEATQVTTQIVSAIADAMCIRCPVSSCHVPLDPRPDGCMALRCAYCATHFCFLCLEISDSTESCHAHVQGCELNPTPGDYFTTPGK